MLGKIHSLLFSGNLPSAIVDWKQKLIKPSAFLAPMSTLAYAEEVVDVRMFQCSVEHRLTVSARVDY